MSGPSKALIRLVQKSASESNSAEQAQQHINQGADIKLSTSNGPMIHAVIAEEKRQRLAGSSLKADNCVRLINVLEKAASEKLKAQIFSQNGGDLTEMRSLLALRANCYQPDTCGPLGLLGSILNQDKIPIRIETVKLLLESDSYGINALLAMNEEKKTCLLIAKNNPNCSKDVVDYIQSRLDQFINQIPFTHPRLDPNQAIQWIQLGANIEATDQHGNTVLCNAVSANNVDLARALISIGSKVSHENKNGMMPLRIAKAAPVKNQPLITLLERQSVNDEWKQLIQTKKSALTIEEVQELLERGASINASIGNGDSPLHLLLRNKGTAEMIQIFVNQFNADLSHTNGDGYRPIEICILSDKAPYDRLRALLPLSQMTPDKFYNPKLNMTIIKFAIEQKLPEVADIIQTEVNLRLWKCMEGVNTNDDHNKLLMDTISQLNIAGAQINHLHTDKEHERWTVLHLATKKSTVRVLKYMVEKLQADYTIQNGDGDYPICIAAQLGNFQMIEYLHSLSKFNLNVYNKEMQTPLHLAVKNSHLRIVRYLVQWGADDNAKDHMRKTPLDLANENIPKTKEDEVNKKKIILFLNQLICPSVDDKHAAELVVKKPTHDLDTCDSVTPVVISPINIRLYDADAAIGDKSSSIFTSKPNTKLHEAAKDGDVALAQRSLGEGADIRYCRRNNTPLAVAILSQQEYTARLKVPTNTAADVTRLQAMFFGCQQIAHMIQTIASTKIVEAIDKSDAGLVVAYHRAGAVLTPQLLYKTCSTSDNVEIVDYILNQNAQSYQALMSDVSSNGPYHLARMRKFQKVAGYLKYRLSVECTKAITGNNLDLVKKLVSAGANVDMENTNNLNEAIKLENLDLIKLLCENGAKMPSNWLSSKDIVLDSAMSQNMKAGIRAILNQYLIERRFHFAAASGDLDNVIQCQRLGVNINAMNCHGSTALVCTIQHGNYFPIVHNLVSRGASMLHSNESVSASLIDLATRQNFKQIASYLSKELNAQFSTAILNNDRHSAEKFASLGVDFNYKDEQQRTPLHYAVQYHGIDLVTWLCEGGSVPTISDVNGDYPIILAAEKGDYAVVKHFVTKYPATRNQKNKTGMTALEIARKLKFNRIVHLIETGKDAPDSIQDSIVAGKAPTYSEKTLIGAAANGHMKIIKEFIGERYESKQEKKDICEKMIKAAKKVPQHEILDLLEPYYKSPEMKMELASDMFGGSNVLLSDRHKKILLGVLGSLNNLIAHSSVLLDPADPNTYTQFFVSVTDNISKQSKELANVKAVKDIEKLVEQDEKSTNEKLTKIQEQLEELLQNKSNLESHVLDTEKRLSKEEKLTALQRKEFIKEKELHEQQLATYECSIFLFQRQQEAIINRQNAIEFLKSNANLILFYRTIENRLEALFHSYLAAQGGYVKIEQTTKFSSLGKLLHTTGKIADKIPIINVVAGVTKGILAPVLSKMDEKQQKKEWHNLSALGNIEELGRIASETAGLITLYYNEQIQSINPSMKIVGSNVFNETVHWLKQLYDVRPETSEEMVVVMVAEYVTAWIIDGLKLGTNISLTEPLPPQLWLHVAKQDPIDTGKLRNVTDVLGITAGKVKIPIEVKTTYGKKHATQVQLQYLIGCVSVINSDGDIYQYAVPENTDDKELMELEYFGYTCVTPFASDENALQAIVEGRRLRLAKRDQDGNVLTRFRDIMQHAKTFIGHQEQTTTDKSIITQETANKIADVLREKKTFVDSHVLHDQLRATQEKIELSVDVLSEKIDAKVEYYQTSIDAAHEKIAKESEHNREAMIKDNKQNYDRSIKKISDYSEQVTEELKTMINQRLDDIAKDLNEQTKKILLIVEAAKVESSAAMKEAHEANERSRQAVENAQKAANSADQAVKWAQQRSEEFQRSIKNCEETIKQTASAQKQQCEQTISEIRTKTEQDIARSRDAVTKSAADAKASAQAARELASTVEDTEKAMKKLMELHKTDLKKLTSEAHDARKESERAAAEAKEAQRQSTRAAEIASATTDKVNTIQKRIEKAVKQIEKAPKILSTEDD